MRRINFSSLLLHPGRRVCVFISTQIGELLKDYYSKEMRFRIMNTWTETKRIIIVCHCYDDDGNHLFGYGNIVPNERELMGFS